MERKSSAVLGIKAQHKETKPLSKAQLVKTKLKVAMSDLQAAEKEAKRQMKLADQAENKRHSAALRVAKLREQLTSLEGA